MTGASEDAYKNALSAALRYIRDLDHTEFEVKQKLRSKDFSDDVIRDVIDYLKENNYINDRRYAEYYIVCYKNRRSVLRIKMDLEKRGIDDRIISESMEETEISSSEAVLKALQKQIASKKVDIKEIDYKSRNKIFAALSRQGFTFDEIRKAFDELRE